MYIVFKKEFENKEKVNETLSKLFYWKLKQMSPLLQLYSWTGLHTMEQVNDPETNKSDLQNDTLDFNKA